MTADSFAKVLAAKVLTAATLLAVVPTVSHAQDLRCERGDLEVRTLEFSGNRTFAKAELGNLIVTTPSAFGRRTLHLPFSTKRCLNRTEFANDRLRLVLFYRRHGFPEVEVDTALVPIGPTGVKVHFTIREGRPSILEGFTIVGLDSIRRPDAVVRNLPIKQGARFDRTLIDATIDTITRRLRNHGYPSATVSNTYTTRAGPNGQLATDSMAVETGPFTYIGPIHVTVEPRARHRRQISDRVVKRLIRIDSGDVYREQAIVDAQRDLYQTDAYLHVGIALDSSAGSRVGRDSMAPLDVSLAENTMHVARLGLGYGTLDCFRVSGQLNDYNLFGGARHLEIQGRLSKIGIGEPLNGAANLCPQAKHDPYSAHLNYYLGATLRQPFFFNLRSVPSLTAYTSRVSEYNAYVRTTAIGGIASMTWQATRRVPITFNYSLDYGRTEAQPALFCAVFNLCTPEDRDRVQQTQRLAVVSTVITHDGSNNALNPTRGGVARLELRYASPWVWSDSSLQFNTVIGDLSRYFDVGNGNVLAFHVRGGAVYGRNFHTNGGFIPPQERMYGGGPNSVRGFAQNELGAVTYLASSYGKPDTVGGQVFLQQDSSNHTYHRAVPVGGNSLLVSNLELRLRSPVLPDVLQFALFTDAGDVWNRGVGAASPAFKLKVTPGVQAAAITPVGPVRLVVGYNPYQRPNGPLYYESSSIEGGTLPCISPNNGLPLTEFTPVDPINRPGLMKIGQTAGKCPATFEPAKRTSFRSRLTFSLAIGQAF